MKRFYREVAVEAEGAQYRVTLDGRVLRTPLRNPLRVPTRRLADAIAAEWRDQGEELHPQGMVWTQLANTALDRVPEQREGIVDALVGYGGSDLVCYRAASPQSLAQAQAEAWQPLVDWMATRYGIELCVTLDVQPVTQPPALEPVLRRTIALYDDMQLVGLQAACLASGSIVIALALAEGRLDALSAWRAAEIDAQFQAERWGRVEESTARLEGLKKQLAVAAGFLERAAR